MKLEPYNVYYMEHKAIQNMCLTDLLYDESISKESLIAAVAEIQGMNAFAEDTINTVNELR